MILTDMTVKAFCETLASDAPAPGGGSAAALSGALGAALIAMVCRLTQGKEQYAEFKQLALDTAGKADELMRALLDGVQKDTNAFDGVIAAFGLPKGTDEEKKKRSEAIQVAYKAAIVSPETTAEDCLAVMRLAEGMLHKSNKNAASDLAVGAMQAFAGLSGAIENVTINLPAVKDTAYVEEKRRWIEAMETEAEKLLCAVRTGVAKMLA